MQVGFSSFIGSRSETTRACRSGDFRRATGATVPPHPRQARSAPAQAGTGLRWIAPTGLGLFLSLASSPALAQTQGWGNLGKKADEGFSWTAPLWPTFWMAWTPATLAVFIGIFTAMAILTILEIRRPGGDERQGVLGLTTTRGDRLFISLLGTSYIFMAWLGLFGMPLWSPLFISLAWGAFCFWKV